ncbi:MAG: endonuclease/exonuclease/phosphatase family protein, partial [Rhodospirillaceae bacterium]
MNKLMKVLAASGLLALSAGAATATEFRVATFNASLNRNPAGQLVTDLSTPDNAQARAVAEVIQRVNPDIILINEFDFVANKQAANLFQQNYLGVSQNGAAPINFAYGFVAPSNTGIASGFDLNNNGAIVTTPGAAGYGDDAYGFGAFPGQFGMVVYSKLPIVESETRTFQNFLWTDMPGAALPDDPSTAAPADWYSATELEVFRLSSKSHWDIPVEIDGKIVHILASHPTPPVFDGAEDRNGRRNHDEIRLFGDYVTPGQGDYIYDDSGKSGGLPAGERFVLLGDQNGDPFDGDSFQDAIEQLLGNPRFDTSFTPSSAGGPAAAARQDAINDSHQGDPRYDTADFADTAPGNLRADYVLPSADGLDIVGGAVFWPELNDPLFR